MNRFSLTFVLFLSMLLPASAQRGGFSGRSVIGQTQSDLRRSNRVSRGGRRIERERIQNAMRHLSDFDRRMSRGRFDKGILDTAIDDVNNVVRNNTLTPADRDALNGDLQALRDMRARRGVGY